VVALDLDHVRVDAEAFLKEGAAALSRHAEPADARRRLQRIVGEFPGEVLSEDMYADWAVGLRDEVHAMFSAALRAIIQHPTDRPDDLLPYLARLIDADPYDEPAHTQLIAALMALGRYGAARRAHERYAARMRELGLSPAPLTLPAAPSRDCVRSGVASTAAR
jgi:DNA-binding SARP family transcriptional activator